MASYYVNNNVQSNGDHEVHLTGCSRFPTQDYTYLGDFSNCDDAVNAAKNYHDQVNGCYWCSRSCHTG